PPRQIHTERLLLREPRPADADALFAEALGSKEVLRHMGLRHHALVEQTRQQLSFDIQRWLKQSAWLWIVALPTADQPDGQALGQVELSPMSYPGGEAHHLRLGYVLARPHWGHGYMSEAVRAVLQAAWDLPAVWRVDALCDVDNAASVALLERVGMRCEGRLGRVVHHPNASDTPRDAWLYALTRDDGVPGRVPG
ncbi:MAG: hypothetical protein RI920_1460, partial [Pseudomonadota bacterium]